MRVSRCVIVLATLIVPLIGHGQDDVPTGEPKVERNGSGRSVKQIAAAVRPSLVKVTQEGREGDAGLGSGFVISRDGLIATNRHVIGEGRRLKVETSDGKQHEVIEVYASDNRLDLAILRVKTRDLPMLELGDSDAVEQGDPIVAMGNPEGLTYSVVEGVISESHREIDGQSMIQVAVPIERGNSGGPLLDRRGRVLGVLTLKSMRTENLGFAMPINELKKLIERPNPVPIERWLTIGVLNPRFWKTVMGSQWTQRAGLISVSQAGTGFGGRSLCLSTETVPQTTFEASVSVRLNDEAGAAGLAFCSDGSDQHYGFYPTGGRIRLTRFDGSDVFSWKILAEISSPAYQAGEWNTFRVRVDGKRIQGFVNGQLAIELEDDGLRGGQAGLCKFRATSAGFKNFKVGQRVSESAMGEDEGAKKALELVLSGELKPHEAQQEFLKDAGSSLRLIEGRQRALEKNALMLKELGEAVHQSAIREALVAELSKPEESADLLRCALLLSKHDNADLDVESYEHGFAQMIKELKSESAFGEETGAEIELLNRYLFEENGFHGSRSDYSSRSNSYINEVLDDREGLPITLSVVYLELARRLGIKNVAGIPLPGRFMVGYRVSAGDAYSLVDVFDGGKRLSMAEALALVSEGGTVPASAQRPATKREIILRMLRNILGPILETRKLSKEALPYLDLVLALDAEANLERVTRAMLRETSGDLNGASSDVHWMLEHQSETLQDKQRGLLEAWLQKLAR